MKDFNKRLREERKRLGLNQDKFAVLGGVTKDTQLNYENASRKPDSDYLSAIASAGVDVLYLLTGEYASSALSDYEKELLSGYRALDIRGKAGVFGMIDGMSKQTTQSISPVFHGDVGQNVYGNTEAPNTIAMPNKGKKK
jgi:transcriptional regulator with XRE-family HTH domain